MKLRKFDIADKKTTDQSWPRYIITVFATILCMLVAYIGSLAVLKKTGHLPPPPIVNEICADEKLMWLRQNPPNLPDFLMVGSSIAWRDIDSREFVTSHVARNPLNGGLCHATTNQTLFATKFFLRHFASVRTVVTVVVPEDFADCPKGSGQLFNPKTADDYVFAHQWSYGFYIRQFDPVSLVRDAIYVHALRDGENKFNSLQMTKYGDGPLYTSAYMGLMYGAISRLDPRCFAAMHKLALTVAAGGRKLFVGTAPMNPRWEARNDPSGQQHAEMVAQIRAALQGTGAAFWDGDRMVAMSKHDFTDAMHINWPAAKRFTATLAAQIIADKDQA